MNKIILLDIIELVNIKKEIKMDKIDKEELHNIFFEIKNNNELYFNKLYEINIRNSIFNFKK